MGTHLTRHNDIVRIHFNEAPLQDVVDPRDAMGYNEDPQLPRVRTSNYTQTFAADSTVNSRQDIENDIENALSEIEVIVDNRIATPLDIRSRIRSELTDVIYERNNNRERHPHHPSRPA